MRLVYRPDIDGLRAIAVLAVLFFHTDIPGFGGGFVGVDIFFVISGFLITSILLKDFEDGDFSIARFYERRIRRIFPALFPVMAFTLVVSAFLFDASIFRDYGKSVTMTTLFSSNVLFRRQSGYFDLPSLQKPLLHTWSLSVEEQFYILFPLTLLLVKRFLKKRYLPWLLVIAGISLTVSIFGVYKRPTSAFYLVQYRAWELMAGAIVAMEGLPVPSSTRLKNLLSISGIALLIYSIGFYTETMVFPGYNALVPVIGAGLIIYSGKGSGTTIVAKLLELRPLVFIGLISYSLYLWHWPMVVFCRYLSLEPLSEWESIGIIAVSLLMGVVSWKYIEQPFRGNQSLIPDRKRLFALSLVVMIVASGIGQVIYLNRGLPIRHAWFYPGMTSHLQKVQQDPEWDKYGEWEKGTEHIHDGLMPHRVGADNIEPTVALWGDSHARALIPAIDEQSKRHGVSCYIITRISSPALLGVDIIVSKHDNSVDESKFSDDVLRFLKDHPKVKTVILSGRWPVYANGDHAVHEDPLECTLKDTYGRGTVKRQNAEVFRIALARTVNYLCATGHRVILVSDVPEVGYDVPRYYSLRTRFPMLNAGIDIRPSLAGYTERNRKVRAVFDELSALSGVTVAHPEKMLFDSEGRGMIMVGQELLYRDDDHLSTYGAHFVAPAFNEAFFNIARPWLSSQTRGDRAFLAGKTANPLVP
ncbi:MAG: acyltransferase [Chlorobiaceae bacterium]|nr:acyltransferase [Chlorobiaceae bacterium]